MNKLLTYLLSYTILLLGIACTPVEETEFIQEQKSSKEIRSIQVRAHDFIGSENITRTVVEISDQGASFKWGKNDTIGIFPTNGYQVAFPMSLGTGLQNAEFDGSDWTLKASKQYAAYYPFDYENRSYKNVAISYLGQKQTGNGSTDHLGKYDYMAANITTPSEGNVTFDFRHLGALIQWKLTMPESGNFTKLTLKCKEQVFTHTGTLDMSKETMAIASEQKHKRVSMDLDNVSTYNQGQMVMYMMISPTQLKGQTYSLILSDNTGKMMATQLEGKNFEAGKAYSISADNFEDYEEDALEMIGSPLKLANGTRDTLTLEYQTNKPLTYTISEEAKDWISPIECNSRVTSKENMQFDIKENSTETNREGTITLTSFSGDISITYTILQGKAGFYAVSQEKGCIPPTGFIYCNYPATSPVHGLYALADNNPETYFEVEAQNFEIVWECLEPFHLTGIMHDLGRGKHQIFMTSVHVSDDGENWIWDGSSWGYSAFDNFISLGFSYDYNNKFYKLVVESNHGAPTTQIPGLTLKSN